MTPSVRIASLVYPDPGRDRAQAAQHWQRFAELQQVLKRHLPEVTASLFARPVTTADPQGAVDWYSDLAGQPVPLLDLPPDAQDALRGLLADRLQAIAHLADALEQREPEDRHLAELLRHAVRYPGDASVYAVAGAPVLTSWGGTEAGSPKGSVIGPGVAGPTARSALRSRWPVAVLGALLIAGLGIGTWLWLQQREADQLHSALSAAMETQCDPIAPLAELSVWLDRVDPDAERYPDVRMAVLTELGLCDEASALAEQLADAPCDALPALADYLSAYDPERQPFLSLNTELQRRQAACQQVQGLQERLAAAPGDCTVIAALDREVQSLDAQTYPLTGLRTDLDQALAACRLAADLGPRIEAAQGNCPLLRELAREAAPALADEDAAPLQPIRDALYAELARCDLADHLERELAQSQGDCLTLAGLKETLLRHDTEREPLAALLGRIEVALGQCAALTDLEQRFATAMGDCALVKALDEGIGAYRNNLRFLDIRTRLQAELEVCAAASALEERIAEAGGDCAKARALAADLTVKGNPRFAKAEGALKAQLADCDRVDRYTRLLADAGQDCPKLKALKRKLDGEPAKSLAPLRRRLAAALEPCKPKPPVVAPRPMPSAQASDSPKRPPAAARPPSGSSSFAMTGECTGQLVVQPSSGWDGDGVRHIVTIDPPASARVARVTSTNRGCRNCGLGKVGANTWRGDFWYRCSGRGIIPVSYSAYDASGRLICSGKGSDLCLGGRGGSLGGALRALFGR